MSKSFYLGTDPEVRKERCFHGQEGKYWYQELVHKREQRVYICTTHYSDSEQLHESIVDDLRTQ